MKSNFYRLVVFSSLMLIVSSCADYANSEHSKTDSIEYAHEQQLDDNQIINIMMTVDKGEISASQETIKKKASPIVEHYAKYLIEQHEINLEQLMLLSRQLKLEPKESVISSSMINSGKHDLKTLSELKGEAFDKAYIDGMVKDHQGGLKLIDTKLIPQAKNPQLKSSLEKFRIMVADHLEKGLEIQSKF